MRGAGNGGGGHYSNGLVVHFIGAFVAQGLLQKPVLADAPGCRSRVRWRRIAHRKHQGAAGVFLQADEQGGKVRIAGKNDEFVKVGGVGEVVHAVHHQMDICAGLAAGGQRRAVHHLKCAADEGVTVFLIALGVQVAHALEDAAAHAFAVKNAQRMVFNPAHPPVWNRAKGPGRLGVNFKKAGVNIVEVNVKCTEYFVKTGKSGHIIPQW
ncbi:hypothetical protein DSECCO2_260570 [anaerobic digester metagenome]